MFVIYNKETTVILQARARSVGCYVTSYKSQSAAKAALTRLDNKGLLGADVIDTPVTHPNGMKGSERTHTPFIKDDFVIIDAIEFRSIEKTVTRINAMTGKPFQERVNAPFATSPASESYWCS